MKSLFRQTTLLALLVLAAGLAAGCGQAATKTPAPPVSSAPPGGTTVLGGDKVALQTLVPANSLGAYEKAAAARGVGTYTGYACTIAPAGCACEDALVQDSNFTFTPDNQLIYDFTLKGGKPAQWQLDHAGFNQWSYTAPVAIGEEQQDAILLALLSFTNDGYVVTEVANFPTGEVSKCESVPFHLLGGSGTNP